MKDKIVFAEPLTRFYAYMIDSAIILFSMFIILFFIQMTGKDINIYIDKQEIENVENIDKDNNILSVKTFSGVQYINKKTYFFIITLRFYVSMIYYLVFLNMKKQATIGQQVLHIMTIHSKKGKINILDSVVIFFGRSIINYFYYVGYLTMFFTKEKTGIHDLISDSRVVKLK